MTRKQAIPSAFSRGWMLCSPAGKLQPATLRKFRGDAIAAKFRVKKTRDAAWEEAQAKGWTARFVYVRFFVPVFKSTHSTNEKIEVEDDEDV